MLLSVVGTREAGWTSLCCAIQYFCTVQCDWACRQNSEVCELRKTWNFSHGLNWRTCIWHTVQHLQVVVLHRGFTGIDLQTVGLLIIRHFPAFIGDSTPTSRWPRTGPFVRTCRGTVLRYVENKVPLALKYIYMYIYIYGSKPDSFLRKGVSCSVLFTSYCLYR